jgi:glycosyltransferase involved in cell wall biosynthesis
MSELGKDITIAIVNRHRDDKIGGSELQCNFIAEKLIELGHHVSYVVPGGNGPYQRNYLVIPCSNEGEAIAEAVVSTVPDIVYWRYNKIHFYEAAKRIKKSGIPIIFATSSVGDVRPGFIKQDVGLRKKIKLVTKSYWNHRGFRYVDAVVVNNKDHLDLLPVDYQEFIPNGMMDDYTPFEWSRPYSIWVSSLKHIKRPEKVVDLAHELPEMDFIMAGEIQEKKYDWFRDKERLPDNLFYMGVKTPEEINGMLKGAILHLHTCYPEGFPNVFIQAWMQGTPSVSLGFDPSNYLLNYNMGYNAKDDWESFLNSVISFIKNNKKRDEYGSNARQFAKSTFVIEKSVTKLEEVIMKTLHLR